MDKPRSINEITPDTPLSEAQKIAQRELKVFDLAVKSRAASATKMAFTDCMFSFRIYLEPIWEGRKVERAIGFMANLSYYRAICRMEMIDQLKELKSKNYPFEEVLASINIHNSMSLLKVHKESSKHRETAHDRWIKLHSNCFDCREI